jgi:hypothetical protein
VGALLASAAAAGVITDSKAKLDNLVALLKHAGVKGVSSKRKAVLVTLVAEQQAAIAAALNKTP